MWKCEYDIWQINTKNVESHFCCLFPKDSKAQRNSHSGASSEETGKYFEILNWKIIIFLNSFWFQRNIYLLKRHSISNIIEPFDEYNFGTVRKFWSLQKKCFSLFSHKKPHEFIHKMNKIVFLNAIFVPKQNIVPLVIILEQILENEMNSISELNIDVTFLWFLKISNYTSIVTYEKHKLLLLTRK